MESAFGVQHSLSKSLVPGAGYSIKGGVKGYKRAVDLTGEERARIKNNPVPKKIKERGGRLQMAARRDAAGKTRTQMYPGVPIKRGKLTAVVAQRHPSLDRGIQGYSQPDGRGGGNIVIHSDAVDRSSTIRHEKAHIAPKRNPVRFQERSKNPTRLGREEGRADFTASGKQTTGQYPGPAEFQSGYNEVQGKMAAAKFKRNLRKK